jgi:DNA-binding CsgD family transcriptional regulator
LPEKRAVGHPEVRALALAKKSKLLSVSGAERIDEAEAWALAAQSAAQQVGAEVQDRARTALLWARIMRGHPVDLTPSEARVPHVWGHPDRARTLLFLGGVQRRYLKRAAARKSLEEAAAQFELCGCSGWAARGRSELARVSGRRPAAEEKLTPSERQVVDLAVRGLSNNEIAGQLVVSVYTVEAHLSHAYAKLGVRSRTQLARMLSIGAE